MKRKLATDGFYSQPASFHLACQLGGITRRRMGEPRDDTRDRMFRAKFFLHAAKWQRRFFGFPIFVGRPLFVWNGETHRTPVLP